jgi:hypothetical protein
LQKTTHENDIRFYVKDFLINEHITDALVDTGSEVSLISESLLEVLIPNWKALPDSVHRKVVAHNGSKISIVGWKQIPFKLTTNSLPLWWHFGIQRQEESVVLLGNDFNIEYGVELVRRKGKMYMKLPKRHSTRSSALFIPLSMKEDIVCEQDLTSNAKDERFAPLEVKIVELVSPIADEGTEVLASATSTSEEEGIEVIPSVSQIFTTEWGRPALKVQVVNKTNAKQFLRAGQLQVQLEFLDQATSKKVDVLGATCAQLKSLSRGLNSGNVRFVRQIRSADKNSSAALIESYNNDKYRHTGDPIADSDYKSAVKLNCEWQLAPDAISTAPSATDPLDKVPLVNVEPKFHHTCLELLRKHEDLLARHQLDAGDCSKSLGYMYLPLSKPLPKTRRIFHCGLEELKIMQDLLIAMEANNLIQKTHKATYASPCFLLQKRSKQSTCRFIVSLTALNDCLAKPISVLPNMQAVIESVASHGPSLMTTLDMAHGFASVKIYPGHQHRIALISPFGVYKMLHAPMGLASSPTIYQSKINEALMTCPENGTPDPIEGVVVYLDDVTITSKLGTDEVQAAVTHKEVVDRVMTRLKRHGFKINPAKLQMFQRKASILGVEVENGTIKVDESRFTKMSEAPPITNKKSLMMWLGFLASIKHYSPIELSIPRATLTELLEGNRPFKWEERHELAFRKIKEILSSEKFVVHAAKPNSVKVLFTDASSLQSGAILLEAEFEPEIVLEIPHFSGRSVPKFDPLNETLKQLDLEHKVGLSVNTPADGDCFFHAVSDQLDLLHVDTRPKNVQELRIAIVAYLDSHPEKLAWKEKLRISGVKWAEMISQLTKRGEPTDSHGLILQAAADYLSRDILVVEVEAVRVHLVSGTGKAAIKPPLWLALYRNEQGNGHFQSLVCAQPNLYSHFTSHHKVENDENEMSKEQILLNVKDMIRKRTSSKHKLKAIAFDAQVVKKAQRHKPIYELELAALINYLHKFKPYIRYAIATIVLVDSSVAYYLTDPKVNISSVRTRRINVMLAQEYDNLIFHLIPSNQNWADLFSRYWIVEPEVSRAVKFKDVKHNLAPEFEEQLVTLRELRTLSERYSTPELEVRGQSKSTKAISIKAQEALQDYTTALKTLAERLSPDSIIASQREEFPFLNTEVDPQLEDPNLSLENGILMYKNKILIPEKLTPLVLAYEHLSSGHCGRTKLMGLIQQKYFFPNMHEIVEKFTKQCHTCFVNNPLTGRKIEHGTYPIPTRAFEVVFLDLMEGVTGNVQRIKDYLIVTDYLSRAVYVFPMTSKTPEQLVHWLKVFFMMSNMCTRVLVTDNGQPFRSERVLKFVAALGINMPQTLPYHPSSRGVVEVSVSLVKMLLKKLLINNRNYDSSEIYFMASLLINNSFRPAIQSCPSEIIFGTRSMELGSLGSKSGKPALTSKLLDGSMRGQVIQLRELIDTRVKLCREALEISKQKYLDKINKSKLSQHKFEVNDIVFVTNLSLPPTGVSHKFRPKLYKSPFIVLRVGPKRLSVMRLTDNLVMLVHPDRVRKFSKKDEIFDQLPAEVKLIVGSALTPESLRDLAKIDQLDSLYLDHLMPSPSKPVTRAAAAQGRSQSTSESEDDNEDEDDATLLPSDSKRVTFASALRKKRSRDRLQKLQLRFLNQSLKCLCQMTVD